jgi:hypothetical protein
MTGLENNVVITNNVTRLKENINLYKSNQTLFILESSEVIVDPQVKFSISVPKIDCKYKNTKITKINLITIN